MSLFKIADGFATRLKPISKIKGKSFVERDIQTIFEQNMEELLGIQFLASEYSTSFGGRMDSLGIDTDGNPCIIEYKKGQNENVINQGLSYLWWLLDHKDSFEKLCQEKRVRKSVQWESPRVICVAESYSKFDADTADILPIKVELYKYKLYENDLLTIDIENRQKVKIQGFSKKITTHNTSRLQKTYTLEDHTKNVNREILKLFESLKERILAIDKDITEEPKKYYIAYKTSRNIVDVTILKSKLVIMLNMKSGTLDDPRVIARDLETPKRIGHWGNGDYEIKITNDKDLDYIVGLIQQSYDFNQ